MSPSGSAPESSIIRACAHDVRVAVVDRAALGAGPGICLCNRNDAGFQFEGRRDSVQCLKSLLGDFLSVAVQVDESGADDLTGHVDRLPGFDRVATPRRDLAVGDRDAPNLVGPRCGIDDTAAGEHDVVDLHQRCTPVVGRTAWPGECPDGFTARVSDSGVNVPNGGRLTVRADKKRMRSSVKVKAKSSIQPIEIDGGTGMHVYISVDMEGIAGYRDARSDDPRRWRLPPCADAHDRRDQCRDRRCVRRRCDERPGQRQPRNDGTICFTPTWIHGRV